MHSKLQSAGLFASADARRLAWLCGALLVLSALALNLRVLDFGFLYLRDDDLNVALNPHLGELSATHLKWMFTNASYARRYIPLGWLNFSATYAFAGLDPAPYHALGLGMYLANAALVLVVILLALRLFAPGKEAGLGPWDVGCAALAAGWWAFHPFRVETTAWISGNLYGQSAMLLLASIAAYLRSYRAEGGRRMSLLGLSAAAYAASLLTYPIALGVPVLLAGLDWLYCRSNPGRPFRRLLAEKSVFLVPLAAILWVTVAARFAGANVFGAVPGMAQLPLSSRVAQAAYIAAYYIWKPLWPAHLSPLYDTLVDFRPLDPIFLFSMAAVAAVSIVAVSTIRKRPALSVAWFGYLAVAAPFFGLTEKPHMASDRYGYFLAVIMAFVLAACLSRISSVRLRTWSAIGSLCLIGALGCLTVRQFDVWASDRAQHAYVAAHLTNAELLDDFTSRQLILEFLRGDEEAASRAVAAQLRRNPGSPGYRKAADIFAEKNRIGPYYGHVSFLAIMQEQMGLAFARKGELREANDHLEAALSLDERFYQAAYDRALVLLDLGRPNEALGSYLLSERWAAPSLTRTQSRVFLERLQRVSEAQGDARLASSAQGALRR